MRITKLIETSHPYITDGGLETFMVFEKGFELPCFSSHILFETKRGRKALEEYYERFLKIAQQTQRGYVLGTETWRLNNGWANELGLSHQEVMQKNIALVEFAKKIRAANETMTLPIIINGIVGPAGDGYVVEHILSVNEAHELHASQIQALGKAGVDMISALTLTHVSEAVGIAKAAHEIDVPAVISFTLETDGKLPSGQSLRDAITEVDEVTDAYPIFYMINCAHPDHFCDVVANGEEWTKRIGGIRANASRMSHAELDKAEELDSGDAIELGDLYSELLLQLPNIRLIGGCCGTDHSHVSCMATD